MLLLQCTLHLLDFMGSNCEELYVTSHSCFWWAVSFVKSHWIATIASLFDGGQQPLTRKLL